MRFVPVLAFLIACSSHGMDARSDGSNGSNGSDGSISDPGGPMFLSFGTNITTMMEGDTVKFVAVLTHPEGISALAGGHLTDPTGNIQYDAFVADQQGAYSVSLTWPQIYTATKFQFTGQDPMMFVAEFFDTKGRRASKTATVTLACNDATSGTCTGACKDFQNDAYNCGGCGKDCTAKGISQCAQAGCVFGYSQAATDKSCADICASAGSNVTCSATSPSTAYYGCNTGMLSQLSLMCSDVPPPMNMSCPIYRHDCGCSEKL